MATDSLPPDYLHRVYAGVLGKLIGVYLGRPFEGWTHQHIMAKLGPIRNYVHDQVGVPLLVTDDDVSGTFTFIRALEEHVEQGAKLTAEAVGKTWLNMIVDQRTILWWGGRGVSTEHTAYLNLREGISAPHSGSIATNGTTVAEQIGAQIFIDGWALVAPGKPDMAASLARAAGSVSHDGESVHAAALWAAMEAEAFVSKDVQHLLDTGLAFVPEDSLIAKLVADVRGWVKEHGDWLTTRQKIEDVYGYDKFHGVCHVVPNHGIMIMALLYAGQDFDEAMHIINTCGWDTDCNSGNVGCLVAIMHGLSAFAGKVDWRGPVADRAIISSADGGYSMNNAARIAMDIANLGRRMAREPPLDAPKGGLQYHFTLPGSVQGFRIRGESAEAGVVRVEQAVDGEHGPGLAIRISHLPPSSDPIEVTTDTFAPKEELVEKERTYHLLASPLVYPGQEVTAVLRGHEAGTSDILVNLHLKVYSQLEEMVLVDGPAVTLSPGKTQTLRWTIPDDFDGQSIQQIGITIKNLGDALFTGTIWLDSLGWTGTPNTVFRRPQQRRARFWSRAWVDSMDRFLTWATLGFTLAKNTGEGIISQGTREWTNYKVTVQKFTIKIGQAGVLVRVRGLNRWYALVFREGKSDGGWERGRHISLVKAWDERRIELASQRFDWALDTPYEVVVSARNDEISANVQEIKLAARDGDLKSGGLGLVVTSGSIAADSIKVEPVV